MDLYAIQITAFTGLSGVRTIKATLYNIQSYILYIIYRFKRRQTIITPEHAVYLVDKYKQYNISIYIEVRNRWFFTFFNTGTETENQQKNDLKTFIKNADSLKIRNLNRYDWKQSWSTSYKG